VLLAARVTPDEPVVPKRFARPARRGPSQTVRRRRAAAQELAGGGASHAEIAAALGVTASTVQRDLADPDRTAARAARARSAETCPGCRGPMSPAEGGDGPHACWDCAMQLRQGTARLRIVLELRRWAEERGGPPAVADWRGTAGSWPAPSAVQRLFGSWAAGLEVAGLSARGPGRPRST
jgi:hypothetical protein